MGLVWENVHLAFALSLSVQPTPPLVMWTREEHMYTCPTSRVEHCERGRQEP